MSDDIQVSISLPLDSDGFLRRECPSCEQQFKWFHHEDGDSNAENVDQYFCPQCGEPSGPDSWWTPKQLKYAKGMAEPEISEHLHAMLDESFKSLPVRIERSFSKNSMPEPLSEADDMNIIEPPCHPNEPIKMPDQDINRIYCLVCGQAFAA